MVTTNVMIKRFFFFTLLFSLPLLLFLSRNELSYVNSNSMYPTLQVGDLLIVKPISTERLSKGEICIKKTIDEKAIRQDHNQRSY